MYAKTLKCQTSAYKLRDIFRWLKGKLNFLFYFFVFSPCLLYLPFPPWAAL